MFITIALFSLVSLFLSIAIVNQIFSLKLNKNRYPITIFVLIVNLFLVLSITYLLPLDVSAGGGLSTWWQVIYWLEFVICWVALPVLISYVQLKYLYDTPTARVVGSIRSNVKFYLGCLAAFIGGFVYLSAAGRVGFSDIKPLIISVSHLYSLSYTLVLLSMGLILVPKALVWDKQEDSLYIELSQVNDEMNDSKINILDNAAHIMKLNGGAASALQLEVQGLIDEANLTLTNNAGTASTKSANELYNAFLTEYYNYLYDSGRFDAIIRTLNQSKLRHIYRKVVGVLALAASGFSFYTQLTSSHKFLSSPVLSFLLLVYNTFVSLFALSSFKMFSVHLSVNGLSSAVNALYYSLYSSRLLLPLCFNFITLVQVENTSFQATLYNDLLPLASTLNTILPPIVCVLVPVCYFVNRHYKIIDKLWDVGLDDDVEYSLQDGKYIYERSQMDGAARV